MVRDPQNFYFLGKIALESNVSFKHTDVDTQTQPHLNPTVFQIISDYAL